MGFFKNLKEKLFTLTLEDDKKEKNLQKFEVKVEKKFRKKLLKENKQVSKYTSGLNKSGKSLFGKIKEIRARHNEIDDAFFDELEEVLIMADISWPLVTQIIEKSKMEAKINNSSENQDIVEIIASKLHQLYNFKEGTEKLSSNNSPNIYLVIGTNGSGKTTSIAKLSKSFRNEGKKVILAAADTFRAGAVEQLKIWAERVGADIVTSEKDYGDPASVVYKTLEIAKKGDHDVVIIDTAGRLENKVNLMEQLSKINRVIKKSYPEAPHEVLLVLDATTGQNGVAQAESFSKIVNLTGIVLTKMDGTSKGGIALTIKWALNIPVKYIGLGEKIDDLMPFNLDLYIYGLLQEEIADE